MNICTFQGNVTPVITPLEHEVKQNLENRNRKKYGGLWIGIVEYTECISAEE